MNQLSLRLPMAPIRVETPARDRQRLRENLLRVLERLRQGPANTLELMGPHLGGLRVAARVEELRRAGFVIETSRREGETVATYTLKGEP